MSDMPQKSPKPLVLSMNLGHFWCMYLLVVLIGVIGLWLTSGTTEHLPDFALFFAGFGMLFSLLFGILQHFTERVSVSSTGVLYELPRKGQRREISWNDYMFVYTIKTYQNRWLLFTPVMMDKAAQEAALKACVYNTQLRYHHGQANGCLALSTVAAFSERQIFDRLPPHIRIIPKDQCANLWP